MNKPDLIFDHPSSGGASYVPPAGVPEQVALPESLRGEPVDLPDLSELEVIRHYTGLSRKNFGVDNGFYPLGSCTMKFNPKLNERMAALPGFTQSHPLQPIEDIQGNLQIMAELQELLEGITGFDRVSLQPAAGAQGELTGLMMMKAYFEDRGESRTKVICPDSSHGTNPASVAMCGFTPVPLVSGPDGLVDLEALIGLMDEDTAGMMLTNPNTLGLFEKDILEICRIVHAKGGLMYADGANANALLGVSRFADMGYDICHLNLHKTFSTPHGGGGPGAGPVGVVSSLAPYLPGPLIQSQEAGYGYFYPEKSIGRVKGYYGNFGILLRAYTYIRSLGAEGLKRVTQQAVENANYLRSRLEGVYPLKYTGLCKHEFVIDDSSMPNGVTTMDIAKRLLDYGFHPPTVYFPLIVHGALMIEPTESETRETLEDFAQALLSIRKEAEEDPQMVKNAPHTTEVSRFDEVTAARKPITCYCDDWMDRLG